MFLETNAVITHVLDGGELLTEKAEERQPLNVGAAFLELNLLRCYAFANSSSIFGALS